MEKNNTILIEELKTKISALEEEKTSLLKIVSHDLRSPLNKLFALMGLFKMSGDDINEEQANYIEKMELVISDALSKMRNLMDLKAIEGDGFEVHFDSLKLGKIVGKVIKEHEPAAKRKQQIIEYEDYSIVIETDGLLVQRILFHLISNAIKYSPLGSKIVVKIEDEDDTLGIRVIDGGYGISEKEQENLYKKFAILSTKSTGGESMLGIGLFIAQNMAKNIGANLEYENRDGSTFIFRLPKTRLV